MGADNPIGGISVWRMRCGRMQPGLGGEYVYQVGPMNNFPFFLHADQAHGREQRESRTRSKQPVHLDQAPCSHQRRRAAVARTADAHVRRAT
jgi:hypothetical protein